MIWVLLVIAGLLIATPATAARTPASTPTLVNFQGSQVSPRLAAALAELATAAAYAGRWLDIVSAYRSTAQQQEIYDRWLRGEMPGTPSVAKPGTSRHERGDAVDMKAPSPVDAKGYEWLAANAPLAGLATVRGEPWHWQV